MAAPSRVSTGLLAKLVNGVLILVAVILLVLVGASAYFTYQIVSTHDVTENVTPSTYLLSSYEEFSFTDRAGGKHDGWLLRGLKGAPAIILCPGNNSNRSELLSLAAILQENHFNVYTFNFYGPEARENYSDFGVRQALDVESAVEAITRQAGINPDRAGLYGVTTGGYASLLAALHNPVVKALVADTPFEKPDQMFDAQLDNELGGGSTSFFHFLALTEFHLLFARSKPPEVLGEMSKLEGIPKLFIAGRDTPSLTAATEDLYNIAPQPKRLIVYDHSQATFTAGSDKTDYENEVLNFFLQNLSLRAD